MQMVWRLFTAAGEPYTILIMMLTSFLNKFPQFQFFFSKVPTIPFFYRSSYNSESCNLDFCPVCTNNVGVVAISVHATDFTTNNIAENFNRRLIKDRINRLLEGPTFGGLYASKTRFCRLDEQAI
jgi:hypothetical protein